MALHKKITDESPIEFNPLYCQKAEGGPTRRVTRCPRASRIPTSRTRWCATS